MQVLEDTEWEADCVMKSKKMILNEVIESENPLPM